MSVHESIQKSLAVLDPAYLEIIDESDQHLGHSGHNGAGGSHFRIMVVSEKFAGLPRITRHQLVYKLLSAEIKAGVHALALKLYTPGEYKLSLKVE